MTKMLVFDMDGTIADLYGVEDWLTDLRAERTRPYEIAEPLYNMAEMAKTLTALKANGWKVCVTTWLAKDSTKTYDNKVRTAKKEWLKKYGFPYDEIHLVKYGTTKADCTRRKGGYQVLLDDNEGVRKGWTLGSTVDAANENVLNYLEGLL